MKKVKIIIKMIDEDNNEIEREYNIDPKTFNWSQSRDMIPIYQTTSYKEFGKPTNFIENPANSGVDIYIQGKLLKEK